MWNEQQAVQHAEAEALTAWDQRGAYVDHADAIASTFENLRDTLAEYGVKGEVANIAEAAFNAKTGELFAGERAAGRVMGGEPIVRGVMCQYSVRSAFAASLLRSAHFDEIDNGCLDAPTCGPAGAHVAFGGWFKHADATGPITDQHYLR